MMTMSYYPAHKNYEHAPVHWPTEKDAQELVQFQNGVGISMEFDDIANVRHPVFFMCRDRGVLRLNHRTFYEVNVPDQLMPMLSGSSNVEVVLTYSAGSFTSVFAQVERVLRLPAYLADCVTDDRREEQPYCNEDDSGVSITVDGFVQQWSRTVPRQSFESTIKKKGGALILDYKRGESKFTLAHDGKIPILVSFFDDDKEEWLADEEKFNGEPPLWFAEDSHRQSPLYAVGLAAKYLERLGFGKMLTLVLLSDHITIINEEDMTDDWNDLGINLCYCNRESDGIIQLEHCLSMAPTVNRDLRMPNAAEWEKIRQAMVEFNDQEA